jgi:hypothetical protein
MANSFIGQANLDIGLRNNNPGDFRTGEPWQGAIGSEGGFITFKDISWGLRALALDIINNVNKGVDTIRAFITKYAPPSENDTAGYINFVSAYTSLSPDVQLGTDPDTVFSLMRAIISKELGAGQASKVSDDDVATGLQMAQGGSLATLPAAAAIAVENNPVQVAVLAGLAVWIAYELLNGD